MGLVLTVISIPQVVDKWAFPGSSEVRPRPTSAAPRRPRSVSLEAEGSGAGAPIGHENIPQFFRGDLDRV